MGAGQPVISTAASTVSRICAVARADTVSDTDTVTVSAPAVVGVPVIAPVLDRVSPPGSEPPLSDHE
jgi:hypothetical protein